MALTDVYVQTPNQFAEFFRQLRQGQAPRHFTNQHLKDLGFTSTNHRAFIQLLKALGFLSSDGQPTPRYHDYRNEAKAREVLGQAVKEAYGDLFVLRANPTDTDKAILEGKFKSTHNVSDRVARLMVSTFYALLSLADLSAPAPKDPPAQKVEVPEVTKREDEHEQDEERQHAKAARRGPTNLHYNIQIHLPATKDVEVFNAIFKSLKEHLID